MSRGRVLKRQLEKVRSVGISLAATLAWAVAPGASPAFADEENARENAAKEDAWAVHRLLPGRWEIKIDGRLGQGTGNRHYEFIFNDQFLVGRHASIRLPQEQSPDGDYHRELTIYSFDSERNTIVLRQFIVEGYVLQFTCETESMRFVCVTENIENGTGMAARTTLEFTNPYQFSEVFELAGPGEELQVYFKNTFTRMPTLED